MRSTGEVLGLAETPGLAFFKAQEATKSILPLKGTVLLSINEKGKEQVLPAAETLHAAGFTILATESTHAFLQENSIPCQRILKMHEGRPNIADAIANGEIQLVINTPIGKTGMTDDSYIRKTAIRYNVPYVTTIAAALATANGIKERIANQSDLLSLQAYHRKITIATAG
jgi:carbamoyl-phosphate synthase large subunit